MFGKRGVLLEVNLVLVHVFDDLLKQLLQRSLRPERAANLYFLLVLRLNLLQLWDPLVQRHRLAFRQPLKHFHLGISLVNDGLLFLLNALYHRRYRVDIAVGFGRLSSLRLTRLNPLGRHKLDWLRDCK